MYNNNCNCKSPMPGAMQSSMSNTMSSSFNMPIGMAYVPWQKFEDIYDMKTALSQGTIFSQLDKPFMGGKCR